MIKKYEEKSQLLQNKINSYISITFLILFNWFYVSAQSINPLPPGFNFEVKSLYLDSSSNNLYAAGGFTQFYGTGTNINKIAVWNGSNWDSLGSGVNDNGALFALNKYNGNIIAGGSFSLIGGINSKGLAQWDGTNWIPLTNAVDDQNYGSVGCLYVENSNLYVGGGFDTINGIPAQGIARYDGLNWYNYPPIGGNFHYITGIIVFNNELYIGGNFNGGTGKADILKFDGVNWISVGGGLTGVNTWINDFKIFQNKLYVAGYFQTTNGDPGNNIAIWDGNLWSQPDSGLMPSNVFEMHVFNNKLYAGGQINDANGTPVSFVAVWDGNTWMNFDGNILDNAVVCFASNGNDLYLGGGFLSINSQPHRRVAKYNLISGLNEIDSTCLNIYPTISTGNFTLCNRCQNQSIDIKIFNSMGELLYFKSNTTEKIHNFDLSQFPNGIYIVSTYDFENTQTYKVVKY